MALPPAGVAAKLSGLNTNDSNIPVLHTKTDEDGYQLTMVGDNGEPGKEIKITQAQGQQLAIAGDLARAGFGTEVITMVTGEQGTGQAIKAHDDATSRPSLPTMRRRSPRYGCLPRGTLSYQHLVRSGTGSSSRTLQNATSGRRQAASISWRPEDGGLGNLPARRRG
jgi:hypothetical protein